METMLLFGALGAIGYVLFQSVFGAPQAPQAPESEPEPKKEPAPAKLKAAEKAPAKAKATPKPAKVAPKKAAVSAKSTGGASPQIKNPETGEVVTVPGSYRFVKRWIKDALVTEGLLDKVYKNSELDDAINENIKTAINKLKAKQKYKA